MSAKYHVYKALGSRWFIPTCFVVFVLLRAGIVFLLPVEMHSDAAWFLRSGVGIANGQGYSENGYPTAYWPVGYPGFLGALFWLFGADPVVAKTANILMSAGSAYLVLRITRLAFRSETAARLALLLFALYPNNIAYTSLVLTEIYFTFLTLCGAYLFMAKSGWGFLFASGLLFGLAALTKPQVIFLPGFLILLSFLKHGESGGWRTQFVRGALLYAAMALVLVPWTVRNTLVMGEFVWLSTNGGATLLTGNNPSADGGYKEDDPLVARRNFSVKDQVDADRRAGALARQWISENPRRFLELVPLKAWRLWATDGEAEWMYQIGYQKHAQYRQVFLAVRVANQGYYVALIVGLFISLGLMRSGPNRPDEPWVYFGYVFAIYVTAISMVFSGQSRFHFPVMPWIIMYSAWVVALYLQAKPGLRRAAS